MQGARVRSLVGELRSHNTATKPARSAAVAPQLEKPERRNGDPAQPNKLTKK